MLRWRCSKKEKVGPSRGQESMVDCQRDHRLYREPMKVPLPSASPRCPDARRISNGTLPARLEAGSSQQHGIIPPVVRYRLANRVARTRTLVLGISILNVSDLYPVYTRELRVGQMLSPRDGQPGAPVNQRQRRPAIRLRRLVNPGFVDAPAGHGGRMAAHVAVQHGHRFAHMQVDGEVGALPTDGLVVWYKKAAPRLPARPLTTGT